MPLRSALLPALLAVLASFPLRAADAAADLAAAMARGQSLYVAHCALCHGATGDGVGDTYPPLARSDWLARHRSGAIRAVVNGLKEEITVNGRTFRGQMPPVILDDAQVADVITFVVNSWGNTGGRVTADNVAAVRATADFKTFEALKAAADYRPLPAPPAGWEISELVRLPDFGARLASDGRGGPLYILGIAGSVWRFDPKSGNLKQILWPKDFPGVKPGDFQTLGLVLDAQRRLWITVNQRVTAEPLVLNECGIWRTTAFDDEGNPIAPQPWYRTNYPWGIGPYNHGLSDIRFGRDGLLYVSSGSRTDAGETGAMPHLGKMGETETTGTMWRMDPKSSSPQIEIIARGIRNAYSFNWDGAGNLFTVSNGPDAHAPEEMDAITPPKKGEPVPHHGFPYQMGDAPASHKWYQHTMVPPPPANPNYVLPVLNLGPAALMYGKPTATFNAHSSPTGLTWLGRDWPATERENFLVGRLGAFLAGPAPDEEHGFDILRMKMERRSDGRWTARTTTFLAPLGRPIDLHIAAPGKLYVLEYTRPTDLRSRAGWLPGRVLELKVKK
ncbi:MAG: c-type cytochrome [Opitutaceae bacterium]|nr:c-type cytochrome [Opitutaceae bacterium]